MPKSARTLAVWDVETDPFKFNRPVAPFINGFFDGEIYREFHDKPFSDDGSNIKQFIEFLREADREYIIYAHNGGKFDFYFLMQYLDARIKVINGRVAKGRITLDRQGRKPITHELRDSYLILPLPLSAHKKDDFDYTILERDKRWIPANFAKTKDYLKSDCIYLYEWVKKFTDRFGRKLTLASAAFAQLELTGYEIPKGDEYFDERLRPWYFGGRVEAIQPGIHKRDLVYYDINSAYPEAMLSEHPYGMSFEYTTTPPTDGRMYFARIRAESYGALPLKVQDKGGSYRLDFPRDGIVREYYATSWEIRAGIETNTLYVDEFLEIIIPQKTKNFKAYVDKFYAEKLGGKLSGDKDLETFAKLMLNACYGKFGMDPRKFKESYLTESGYAPFNPKTDDEIEAVLSEWNLVSDEHGFAIWERDAPSDQFYNVATAASITGYVRAKLWRAICAAKFPVYCDTDALIAEAYNADVGNNLGQWKLEADIKEAYIGGKKLYALLTHAGEWKTASKGARLESSEICKICAGESIIWKKDAPAFSLRYGQRFIEREIKMTAKVLH